MSRKKTGRTKVTDFFSFHILSYLIEHNHSLLQINPKLVRSEILPEINCGEANVED